ncbi:competence protein CoiA family protein [Staphylococcus chromogenes]|uniref:competence protein CoiA n=1 Tax=Staphylococcus chromogenes TaxID=46126 RepID=UPI003AFFE342
MYLYEMKLMLTAMNENNEQVSARQASRLECYYCPICKERLILRQGIKVTPHFAHPSGQIHLKHKGGETEQHLKMKQGLFEKLAQHYEHVCLEPYLSTICQIPDITINNQWAIEIQLSPIDVETMQVRTAGLQSLGYNVFWVTEVPKKNKGSYYFTQRHQTSIIHQTRTLYCIDAKTFIPHKITQLTPIASKTFQGEIIPIPFEQWLEDMSDPSKSIPPIRKLSQYFIERYIAYCRRKNSVLEPHLSLMYQLQLSDEQVCKLTGFIFPEQLYFLTHPVYWQLTVLKSLKGGSIPHQAVRKMLQPRYFEHQNVDYQRMMQTMVHAYMKLLRVT